MFPVRCSDAKDNWKFIAEKIKKNATAIFLDLFSNTFPVIFYIQYNQKLKHGK